MQSSLSLLHLISLLLYAAIRTTGQSTTSLFVPVEYPLNSFSASVVGNDASATTFVFDCATDKSCGPVTVIQGPSTAIFTEADQPITTVWKCEFTPSIPTATCLVTSTSPGYSFAGTSTSFYPSESPDAFPTYLVEITAGSVNLATISATTSSMVDMAAVSASIPAITSDLLSPSFRGSMDGSADATSTADSSATSPTATGTTTSVAGLSSSSAVLTSTESSATNSEASSSGAIVGPQKTGTASSSRSRTETLKALIFILSVLFGL
ncbi:hypothetical protein HO173_009868 [Letharia columbiana]|uniref:Uncharacterized protein n=1 Tax=Letharia columbiana TaxID=112416 RepID=A0A8H6FNY9_9LECA|nr:uncharacterized protein HO173_009868 [Letharia columbiana]KAF6232031.1 hypothetical protein HO173_009868 [Letharia columbiana]